uniref:Chromosome 6 open reading frame 163 n=1 Tax=Anas platyrhynchos TaxID=8839 RepID=A0A8B9T1I3_ANAPL
MIRSPDLESFVCCAVCSKIIPPPPSNATFDRIREYKPFRTRYYTHRDILEIGASIQQEQHERKETEIQERIEKMKAELWLFVVLLCLEGTEQSCCSHLLFTLLKEAVRKAKAEMQQYMEEQQRREAEAAEQRMAHRLRCALMECAQEKIQAVAEARKQEREAGTERSSQAAQVLLVIDQLNKEKCNEINIALSIKQKENQIEIEKQLKEAEILHLDELEKVMATLKAAEEQVKILMQKLEKMTAWKDSLENEIQATREAFQKYIDATFPDLSPGQADFILPFRTTPSFLQSPENLSCSEASALGL